MCLPPEILVFATTHLHICISPLYPWISAYLHPKITTSIFTVVPIYPHTYIIHALRLLHSYIPISIPISLFSYPYYSYIGSLSPHALMYPLVPKPLHLSSHLLGPAEFAKWMKNRSPNNLKIDVGCEAGAKRIEHCNNKNDCGTGTNPVTRRLENSMRHTIKPCPTRQIRTSNLH